MSTTFKIGAYTWRLIPDGKLSDEGVRGKCFRDRGVIHFDPNLPTEQLNETILHELLHACNKFVGIEPGDKLEEEEYVTRLAPILYTMLEENNLWRTIKHESKGQ